MKQKTRFKNFGNIGIGLKKAISVDLLVSITGLFGIGRFGLETFWSDDETLHTNV